MRYRRGMGERTQRPVEYLTPERCHITEYLNRASLPSVSVARARVEPGVTTALHVVSVDEWYLIESGEGLVRVGDREPWPVAAGDSVCIPCGVAQQIRTQASATCCFSASACPGSRLRPTARWNSDAAQPRLYCAPLPPFPD